MSGCGVGDETVDKEVGPGAVVDEIESPLVGLELACEDLDLDAKVEGVGVHVVVVGASVGRLDLALQPGNREHDERRKEWGDDPKVDDIEDEQREGQDPWSHLCRFFSSLFFEVAAARVSGCWCSRHKKKRKKRKGTNEEANLFFFFFLLFSFSSGVCRRPRFVFRSGRV